MYKKPDLEIVWANASIWDWDNNSWYEIGKLKEIDQLILDLQAIRKIMVEEKTK